MSKQPDAEPTVRLDQWLHATRFFKTRALAAKAIKGHKVLWNEQRVKPSRAVRVGDKLRVTRVEERFDIEVDQLIQRRVSATLAAGTYTESQESIDRRFEEAEQRRLSYRTAPRPEGRPNKRDRRRLIQFVRVNAQEPSEDGD